MNGYCEKYLDVDLTSSRWRAITVPALDAQPLLGGKGVAAMLLSQLLPVGADPLGPQNVVVINTGPLTGTGVPGSSRFNLSTKSPATGLIASSNCGGLFGLHLKRAGYDGLILRGRSPRSVWLAIDGQGVSFQDATALWGKGAIEVQGPRSSKEGKLAIGPAGENLVKYALVMSGERALARCGVGAVLGSKNLKGATVKGTLAVAVHDPEALKGVIKDWATALKGHLITGDMLHNFGTACLSERTNRAGLMPTRNFVHTSFDGAETHSGEALARDWVLGSEGCYACPVRCGRVVKDPHGKKEKLRGPEYEALGLWGANLCNTSLAHTIAWNTLCDELGMDTISAAVTVGVAMELGEQGLLATEVRFGSTHGVSALLNDIAYRRGIGAILAEGARFTAAHCGAPDIAPHVKGLELPAYHPRNAFGHALSYATANRGGCHLNGGYYALLEGVITTYVPQHAWRGKADVVVLLQDCMEAITAAGGCLLHALLIIPAAVGMPFIHRAPPAWLSNLIALALRTVRVMEYLPKRMLAFRFPIRYFPFLQALESVTGMKMSMGRFLETGERIWNLERMLNLREGLNPRDDTLNARALSPEGDGAAPPMERMLFDYYRARGWDRAGFQKPKTLLRLGLPRPCVGVEEPQSLRADMDEFRRDDGGKNGNIAEYLGE